MGNILILLAQRVIKSESALQSTRLQIEENVGEDIHLHFRNLRIEFNIDEFNEFASAVNEAHDRLNDRAENGS